MEVMREEADGVHGTISRASIPRLQSAPLASLRSASRCPSGATMVSSDPLRSSLSREHGPRDSLVARETLEIPPLPRALASAHAHRRRWRSLKWGATASQRVRTAASASMPGGYHK